MQDTDAEAVDTAKKILASLETATLFDVYTWLNQAEDPEMLKHIKVFRYCVGNEYVSIDWKSKDTPTQYAKRVKDEREKASAGRAEPSTP